MPSSHRYGDISHKTSFIADAWLPRDFQLSISRYATIASCRLSISATALTRKASRFFRRIVENVIAARIFTRASPRPLFSARIASGTHRIARNAMPATISRAGRAEHAVHRPRKMQEDFLDAGEIL